MHQVSTSGVNVSWLFIAIIKSISTASAVSRELKTAGLGQVARPVNRFHSRRQNKLQSKLHKWMCECYFTFLTCNLNNLIQFLYWIEKELTASLLLSLSLVFPKHKDIQKSTCGLAVSIVTSIHSNQTRGFGAKPRTKLKQWIVQISRRLLWTHCKPGDTFYYAAASSCLPHFMTVHYWEPRHVDANAN